MTEDHGVPHAKLVQTPRRYEIHVHGGSGQWIGVVAPRQVTVSNVDSALLTMQELDGVKTVESELFTPPRRIKGRNSSDHGPSDVVPPSSARRGIRKKDEGKDDGIVRKAWVVLLAVYNPTTRTASVFRYVIHSTNAALRVQRLIPVHHQCDVAVSGFKCILLSDTNHLVVLMLHNERVKHLPLLHALGMSFAKMPLVDDSCAFICKDGDYVFSKCMPTRYVRARNSFGDLKGEVGVVGVGTLSASVTSDPVWIPCEHSEDGHIDVSWCVAGMNVCVRISRDGYAMCFREQMQ